MTGRGSCSKAYTRSTLTTCAQSRSITYFRFRIDGDTSNYSYLLVVSFAGVLKGLMNNDSSARAPCQGGVSRQVARGACRWQRRENAPSADGVHELSKRASRFPFLATATAPLCCARTLRHRANWFSFTKGINIQTHDIKFYQKDLSSHSLLLLIPS